MYRIVVGATAVVVGLATLSVRGGQAQASDLGVTPDKLPVIAAAEVAPSGDWADGQRFAAGDPSALSGMAPTALMGGSGIGLVCNLSISNARVTWNRRGYNETLVGDLGPGYCNNIWLSDVDGVWGRSCTQASCWHQVFKVGDGIVNLRDGGRNPLPPYRWVNVDAASWSYKDPVGMYDLKWAQDRGWAIPSLYSISYRLYR